MCELLFLLFLLFCKCVRLLRLVYKFYINKKKKQKWLLNQQHNYVYTQYASFLYIYINSNIVSNTHSVCILYIIRNTHNTTSIQLYVFKNVLTPSLLRKYIISKNRNVCIFWLRFLIYIYVAAGITFMFAVFFSSSSIIYKCKKTMTEYCE